MMDENIEDKSEESRKNHISYYKSLSRVIQELKAEMNAESNSTIVSHLENRIDAMEKDKKRIREMFPDMTDGEIDDNSG
ncbi:MAG: hypothetical protein HKM23_08945 [Nitrosopumilus sp.]|nr:hypothetical protein [Nitrosopumilus sp.]NNL58874.1 hypothetical protein [Nitrosopumilus sp.]